LKDASFVEDDLASPMIKMDRPFERKEEGRNPQEDQIHDGKVPQRAGGTLKASQADCLHDRHREKEQGQRNSQTEVRGKTNSTPHKTESFLVFRTDAESKPRSNSLEL